MADSEIPRLLKPKEAAIILRTSVPHLANLRSQGAGPPVAKIGGRCFYPERELIQYVRDRIVDPTRKAG